jgi:hypothetical protein
LKRNLESSSSGNTETLTKPHKHSQNNLPAAWGGRKGLSDGIGVKWAMGYLWAKKEQTSNPKGIHLVPFHSVSKAVSYDQVLPNGLCE